MQLHRLPTTPEVEARIWNRMARADFQDTVPTQPAPLGCNGNCNQGRACDCVPDIDPPREPLSRWDSVGVLFVMALSVVIAAVWVPPVVGWLLSFIVR